MFGGKHVYALMRLLGGAVSLIEAGTGKTWRDDRGTFLQAKATMDKLLEALGPASGGKHEDHVLLKKANAIGETLTEITLKSNAARDMRSPETAMFLLSAAGDVVAGLSSEKSWLAVREKLLRLRRSRRAGHGLVDPTTKG